MFFTSLIILSICIGLILLGIHDQDEVHQIVAFLSGLIALVCILILTPPSVKILLGLLFVLARKKIFYGFYNFK